MIESGLAPGTGNHEGCPYRRIAGVYFRGNGRGLRRVAYVIENGLFPGRGNHEGCLYRRFGESILMAMTMWAWHSWWGADLRPALAIGTFSVPSASICTGVIGTCADISFKEAL